MVDYKQNARSIINAFLWEELKSSNISIEDQYRPDEFITTIVPIIPIQELPEFNNLMPDLPYIVYDYSVQGYSDDWWICEEELIYTIIANKYSLVTEIMELMIDLFRRIDESGKDLQMFNTKKNILRFYTVSLISASSPEPVELEGGRVAGTVTISYKYSRYLDSNGRYS